MSPSSPWRRLGLNIQEEWIEESSSGQRRVHTLAGVLLEPSHPDVRWGRLSNANEAKMVAKALSYQTVFESYASLAMAYAVWSTPQGRPTPLQPQNVPAAFKTLLEQALARRVWDAVVNDQWPQGMPSWDNAVLRPGLSSWPLGVEIGLWRHLGPVAPSCPTLDAFTAWLSQHPSLITPGRRPKTVVVQHPKNASSIWSVAHPHLPNTTMSWEAWVGPCPQPQHNDRWQRSYVPLSSVTQVPTGHVDPMLNQALEHHRQTSPQSIRACVGQAMGCSEQALDECLSPDQVDAVWMALQQLTQQGSFLLGDETGYGKGRVLAALARVAMRADQRVLFVTEKKALLSDFWRDCQAVFNTDLVAPAVLHKDAKILDTAGQVVVAPKNNRRPSEHDAWCWTTYSQFNRANEEKITAVTSWMKRRPTWLLLDEAQNAASTSTTSQAIDVFKKHAHGIVFSSATFSKNESQLDAYKALFEGDARAWSRLRAAFAADSNTLRTAITLEWAQQGTFLRREHPPMSLPDPHWIAPTRAIIQQQQAFSKWWCSMLSCAQAWMPITNQAPWQKMGAPLSRATREFSLLQKSAAIVEVVEEDARLGRKTVLVTDWTLTSHVQRLMDTKASSSEDNDELDVKAAKVLSCYPTWKQSWHALIDEMFPETTHPLPPALHLAKKQCHDDLDLLPDWGVSPFDDVSRALENKGIRLGEISGRNWMLQQDPHGSWSITPRPNQDRNLTVNAFNDGTYQALILTRAGNSGISLHAGTTFADQRPRHLVEWDVSPDPSVRLQFWGRVRRKDQVCEPIRSTLLIDTPVERRRLERDKAKQQKLSSHSMSSSDETSASWLSQEGSLLIKEWAALHQPEQALLGVHADPDMLKILGRSILLPSEQQSILLSHLEKGMGLLEAWGQRHAAVWDHPSRSIRQQWWWGTGSHALTWHQRVWPSQSKPDKAKVLDELRAHHQGKSQDLPTVLEQWKTAWAKRSHDRFFHAQARAILSWWQQHAADFSRGRAVEVTDPDTQQRVRAIVLGWEPPSSQQADDWSPGQIGVWLWLTSQPAPILSSLLGWSAPHLGAWKPLQQAPQPSWFDGAPFPVSAMVLQGPAWSVVAWGARHAPQGELVHVHDDNGVWQWGWRMPQWWGWNAMLSTDRELADLQHALHFLKEHPDQAVRWRWSAHDDITATSQADGVLAQGHEDSLSHLSYNILKHCPSIKRVTNDTWSLLIPWSQVGYVFGSWFSSGALPTIAAQHALWHHRTWPQSPVKKTKKKK